MTNSELEIELSSEGDVFEEESSPLKHSLWQFDNFANYYSTSAVNSAKKEFSQSNPEFMASKECGSIASCSSEHRLASCADNQYCL